MHQERSRTARSIPRCCRRCGRCLATSSCRRMSAPHAYEDQPLPIGYGQTISQPFIVALMTDLLDLKPDDKVLEIGTGSGYQAAILSPLAEQVYSIEIVPELGARAARDAAAPRLSPTSRPRWPTAITAGRRPRLSTASWSPRRRATSRRR